ncbi:hypothetical protein Tco_0277726 [Tanacetum coccineum]
MASMNTRLNIKKLDGNIVQKHGGSKQVGFKQLGPGVETGVHGVHDEKRVWFEVELQGAQGDSEAEVFLVSNDVTACAQRRLGGSNLKWGEKRQTRTTWSTQQCTKSGVAKHLGVAGLQQQNGRNTTMSTYLVTTSPSSAIGFKMLIDMLGFFGWLASIMQGMLELVKVKCIFMRYRSGSMQVLQRDEFEVELQDGHTFEFACEVIPSGSWIGKMLWQARQMCSDQHRLKEFAVTTMMAIFWSLHHGTYYLVLELFRDLSGNTLRVSQSRIHNEKLVQTLLKGHSILSLEGSLSGTVMWKKLTDVRVFVDFNYAMGRLITRRLFGLHKTRTIESGFRAIDGSRYCTGAPCQRLSIGPLLALGDLLSIGSTTLPKPVAPKIIRMRLEFLFTIEFYSINLIKKPMRSVVDYPF